MGKIFDLIKKKYQTLKDYDKLRKENYEAAKTFNHYSKAYIDNKLFFKTFISSVNNKCSEILGNQYQDFLKENSNIIGENKTKIPEYNLEADLIDYETLIINLEAKLTDEQKDAVFNQFFDDLGKHDSRAPEHIFEKPISKIKNDLNLLNPTNDEITEDEKKQILDSLDYANQMIVENHNGGIYDDIIDDISELGVPLRNKIPSFAEEVGVPANDITELDSGNGHISITFNEPKNYDKFINIFKDHKLNLSQEYKNKILALDNYIAQKSIIKNPICGETGAKEYSFLDWFNKTIELKDEIAKNYRLNVNNRDEKIASYKKIITLKNDLEKITNEYKDVMNYMKSNFDINKVSLPGNIYSGRNYKLGDSPYEEFRPNLPEEFDQENAGYSVLLNGYGQLKGFCNLNGISLQEFLDDPINSFFKATNNRVKSIDNTMMLSRNDNSLGKRMARALYQPSKKYDSFAASLMAQNRAVEFLIKAQDLNEDTFYNEMLSKLATQSVNALDHHSPTLFYIDENNNKELKKLFLFGDDVDNLLTISKEYRTLDNLEPGNPNVFNYENKIKTMENVNPVSECNRVIGIIKDYMAERKYMYDHLEEFCDNPLETYTRFFEPARMYMAAKEYFEDYIYENNIDIAKISNSNDRQMVVDFLCNPAELMSRKFRNTPNLVIPYQNESLDSIHIKFGQSLNNFYHNDLNNFNNQFIQNNQKPNGYNANKDIETIIEDNKGSLFERFFKTTSPEYNALVDAIDAATVQGSATRGDFKFVKYCAKKYLEHKLPAGVNEAKISETGRRRIEFCRTLLESLNSLDDKFKEVSANAPLIDIVEPNIPNMNINKGVNQNFQNEIKDEIDKDNNKEENIIKDNDEAKEIIDVKKDL